MIQSLTEDQKAIVQWAAQNSLTGYAKLMWRSYTPFAHSIKIASHLEAVEAGHIKRLIIEAPPRYGKTLHVSEFFPAWFMGKNPTREVLYWTYAQNQANKVGRKVRNQLSSPVFKSIFPGCNLSQDSKAKNQFALREGGEYNAIGGDGPATGKGAHLAIGDDTIKNRKQAESATYRESLKETYRSSIYTRLYPDAAVVLMQTRWTEDDIIGFVLSEHADEGWVRLTLPAIDESETVPLWPERWTIEKLMKIKAAVGPYDWASLFLQRPVPQKGNIFDPSWWRFYKELPRRFDVMIQSWDMSFKEGSDNSFVVGQVWGKLGPNAYLIYQIRKQMGFMDTLRAVARMCEMFPGARKKLIEDKANGPGILDVLKRKSPGFHAVPVLGSKTARANQVSPIVSSGNVYLPDPKEQPWVLDYIREHATFPKSGQFDDQVDGTTQALDELFPTHGSSLDDLLRM